ncbi:MAG TPA: energy transducer TonB [Ignavibacteriaceae bacterium]|nr:energy transducer TonB [Ignavibacteriaceae bacterium]
MKFFKIKNNLSLLISIAIHLVILTVFYSTGYKVIHNENELTELNFMDGGGGGGGQDNEAVEQEPVIKEPIKEDVISEKPVKKKVEKKKTEVAAKQEFKNPTGTGKGPGSGGGTGGGTGTGSGTGVGPGTGSGTSINIPVPPKVEKKILTKGDFLAASDIMPSPLGGIEGINSKVIVPSDAQGISGTVYVRAFVDELGRVLIVSIDKGLGHGLDQAAANAVKRTKFSPGKNAGKPVKVQVQIPVRI